jgi:hypothetical protein
MNSWTNHDLAAERQAIRDVLQPEELEATEAAVEAWLEHGFDGYATARWVRLGCWHAEIAAAFRHHGIGPLETWLTLTAPNAKNASVSDLLTQAAAIAAEFRDADVPPA